MSLQSGSIEPRQRVAQEVLNYMEHLQAIAADVTAKAEGTLQVVMCEEQPVAAANEKVPYKNYPPLFDEMRCKLDAIKFSLVRIAEYLDRTEL